MGGNGELRMVLTTEEEPLLTASERDEYGLSYYLRVIKRPTAY